MEFIQEPYTCKICNYTTVVKENLVWHNSTKSHLFKIINNLSNEERDNLLKYINDFEFNKTTLF